MPQTRVPKVPWQYENEFLTAIALEFDGLAAGQTSVPAERTQLDDTAWEPWLRSLFALYLCDPQGRPRGFGQHMREFWEWVWELRAGEYEPPLIAIWPRGGTKSTSIELACSAITARRSRRYIVYVCNTQPQADQHVGNIGRMLQSGVFSAAYPDESSHWVGKTGQRGEWRHNRLRTASGMTIDALGLDAAVRGIKMDEQRPDLIVFDDLDDALDSAGVTQRKIVTLTQSVLPVGANHATALGAQNLVIADGIFGQLADGRADFLSDRIVSGPHPAIRDLVYERTSTGARIVSGEPIWDGMDLDVCQRLINRDGLTAFLIECQHETEHYTGGVFANIEFVHCAPSEVPPLVEIAVAIDPAVTDTDNSDSYGLEADGLAEDGKIYRLHSWEARSSPDDALKRGIRVAVALHASAVIIEVDQGGDTWESLFWRNWEDLSKLRLEDGGIPPNVVRPYVVTERAGAGYGPKAHRAQQQLPDYEAGLIVHVVNSTLPTLEGALKRAFVRKPYDLTDATFWTWNYLAAKRETLGSISIVSLTQESKWR
jgi:hypothetical protein